MTSTIPAKKKEPTAKYVLVKGVHFSRNADDGSAIEHKVGSIHELTAHQAKAFKDKFKGFAEYEAERLRTKRVAAALKSVEADAAKEAAVEQARLEEEALAENAGAIEAADNEGEDEGEDLIDDTDGAQEFEDTSDNEKAIAD